MATLALALYLVYIALAFGLRGWLQWRRTGDTGFRLGALKAPLAERAGALLFVLSLALGLLGPVLELLGVLSAFEALRSPVLGTLLSLAGIAGTLHAQLEMGASWRVGVDPSERTALRTDGPFRLVRNPIFSWMILAAAGLALLVPNVAASPPSSRSWSASSFRCGSSRSPTCCAPTARRTRAGRQPPAVSCRGSAGSALSPHPGHEGGAVTLARGSYSSRSARVI